jgi:hypothetical protein
MLRTLAWKELRELLPLALVALLVQVYLVCLATGVKLGPFEAPSGAIPFVDDTMVQWMLLVSSLAAIGLGLWQTMRESGRGTFLFLLHRPLPRATIFAAKLLVGVAMWLAISMLPMVCYALWAATPGTHASPFEWSMTGSTWQIGARLPVLYLAAFLSGLRPARWYGSRLFPLLGGLLALKVLSALLAGWSIVLLATLAIDAAVVLVILDVASARDFS